MPNLLHRNSVLPAGRSSVIKGSAETGASLSRQVIPGISQEINQGFIQTGVFHSPVRWFSKMSVQSSSLILFHVFSLLACRSPPWCRNTSMVALLISCSVVIPGDEQTGSFSYIHHFRSQDQAAPDTVRRRYRHRCCPEAKI